MQEENGMQLMLAWTFGFVLANGFVAWVFVKLFCQYVLKPLLARPLPPLIRPPPVFY